MLNIFLTYILIYFIIHSSFVTVFQLSGGYHEGHWTGHLTESACFCMLEVGSLREFPNSYTMSFSFASHFFPLFFFQVPNIFLAHFISF